MNIEFSYSPDRGLCDFYLFIPCTHLNKIIYLRMVAFSVAINIYQKEFFFRNMLIGNWIYEQQTIE